MPIYGRPRTSLRPYGSQGVPNPFPFMVLITFTLPVAGPVPSDVDALFARQACQDGNDGIQAVVQVTDEAGAPVNLHGAAALKLNFLKPSGVTMNRVPALWSNGYDGKLAYTTVAADLNEDGLWRLQAHFTLSGNKMTTRWGEFRVKRNID